MPATLFFMISSLSLSARAAIRNVSLDYDCAGYAAAYNTRSTHTAKKTARTRSVERRNLFYGISSESDARARFAKNACVNVTVRRKLLNAQHIIYVYVRGAGYAACRVESGECATPRVDE